MEEYITFMTETKAGEQVEMAVVDEFEFEGKAYGAASLVEDDTILEDVFIYRVKDTEEFAVAKLRNNFEYEKVSKAYLEMLENDIL